MAALAQYRLPDDEVAALEAALAAPRDDVGGMRYSAAQYAAYGLVVEIFTLGHYTVVGVQDGHKTFGRVEPTGY